MGAFVDHFNSQLSSFCFETNETKPQASWWLFTSSTWSLC